MNKLKLVILGATGGTGLQLVQQAVERGHQVTALVRSPEKLSAFRDRVTVVKGSLLDAGELADVLRGQDAVLSGFGPRYPLKKGDEHLLEQFATALTTGMQQAGLKRAIVESVAFLFKDSILPPVYLLGKLFFRHAVADASAMERIFQEGDLDWTMVRPPELTNGPHTGRYRIREAHLPRFGIRIARADVADYMLNAAEKHLGSREVVGICK